MNIGDMKMRTFKQTKEEVRYAQLWAEVELPKLLGEKKA
jgi:hypothetical protein